MENPVAPAPVPATRSFRTDVLPVFARQGCLSCHGGSGGLVVATVADLLKGGDHGPAIVPDSASRSVLVGKLGTPPLFGDRMPQGGLPLPAETIRIIAEWIDQGAKDN